MSDDAHERTKAELAQAQRKQWPQTVSTLEAALKTFPAGRVFLDQWTKAEAERDAAQADAAAMRAERDTPEVFDFAKAVVLEAQHQRSRWGADHDGGKADADWFWLIGYLAGKALHNPGGEQDKQLHRIITVAAAACNWHAAKLGKTNMRPGIEPPQDAAVEARKAGG